MSDSSRARLLIIPETVFGATPATLVMQNLRFTKDSLMHKNASAVSDEIRADRMRSDSILLGIDVSGNVDGEFSMNTYDLLIEAALCGTWTTSGVLAGNVNNGVVNRSFLIERGYLDVAQFFRFHGCVVNTWELNISAHSKVTTSFGFMGAKTVRAGTTIGSTITAQTTSAIMASGPLISGITSNTDMTGIEVRSLKLNVNNNLRTHDVIDSLSTADFGRGPMDVTGSMEVYFKNGALFDRFLANNSMAFSFIIGDPASASTYTFLLPKIKLPEVGQDTPGVEADVVQTIGFRALFDATENAQIKISRT